MDTGELHPFDKYPACDLFLWLYRKTKKYAPGPLERLIGLLNFIWLNFRMVFVRVAAWIGSDTFLKVMSTLPVYVACWFEALVFLGAITMGTPKKEAAQHQAQSPRPSPSQSPREQPKATIAFLDILVVLVLINMTINGVGYIYYRCCNWYLYKLVIWMKCSVVGKRVQDWVFSNFLMNLAVLLIAGHHAHIIICLGAFSIGLAATICLVHGRKDDMGILDGLTTCFYICSLTFLSTSPHRLLVTVVSLIVLVFLLICTVPMVEWAEYPVMGKSGRYLVRGFPNIGNSCFYNSVMHIMLSIDPLRVHFLNLKQCGGSVTNELKNLVTGTSLPLSDHLRSHKYLFRIICALAPNFKGNQHQDSHEFLRYLIAELSKEEEMDRRKSHATKKLENSLNLRRGKVELMFTGQLSDAVSCGTCTRCKRDTYPFSDMLLEIPNRNGAEVSLDDCINHFTSHEILSGENSWDCGGICGKVKVNRDSKWMEIHTGPRILTIMLKRYTKLETGRCIKLHNHVKFAERLHLQENPYPKPARKVEYCLIGVVVHVGSMDLGKGHYVVYFRGDRKGRSENDFTWYLASDADVTEVSLGEVLCCDAYMLFYGNSREYGSMVPIDSSVYRSSDAKNRSAFDTSAGLSENKLISDSGLENFRFPPMIQRRPS